MRFSIFSFYSTWGSLFIFSTWGPIVYMYFLFNMRFSIVHFLFNMRLSLSFLCNMRLSFFFLFNIRLSKNIYATWGSLICLVSQHEALYFVAFHSTWGYLFFFSMQHEALYFFFLGEKAHSPFFIYENRLLLTVSRDLCLSSFEGNKMLCPWLN